jgi:ATP-binding cassette subfamily F protein 3
MVMKDKPQQKKKKVKAVSAKDLNPDGSVKTMTMQERKAAYDKEQALKKQAAKAKKEEETAERNRQIRQKELAAAAKTLIPNDKKTVAQLTADDGPMVVSACVARTMGIDAKLKPKDVLAKALEMQPDLGATVTDGALPKEQLLEIAAVLAEQRAAKSAAEARKAAEKAAAKAAELEAVAAEKAEKLAAEKQAAALAREEAAAQRAAEREAEGDDGKEKEKKVAKAKKIKLTKEQKEIQKRMEGTGKLIQAEIAQLEEEMSVARTKAAMARIRGDGGFQLGPIDTGEFALPNPGGGPDLLESASLLMTPGKKYGLIGRNGKGKSTLLKALAARRVGNLPDSMSLHYVSQTSAEMEVEDNVLPADVVLSADVERNILDETIQRLEALVDAGKDLTDEQEDELRNAHERMLEVDGDSAVGRVTAMLKNLGFSEELLARPVNSLSGGWRVRVALAAALFAEPDMLLLDEPTNHLSIEAVLWLANEIATNPIWDSRIVITVSHDRAFLDTTCTDCLHISGAAKRLTQERGNYSTWMKRRVAQRKAFDQKNSARRMDIEHLKEFIGRGGTYSNVSIQRKMKEEQVAKLLEEEAADAEESANLSEDLEQRLTIHCGGRLDVPPIMVSDVTFGYPGMAKPLFSHAEVCVDSGSRLILLGENGRGKTTLVKLMLGELEPTSGIVHRNNGARIALVNQHHGDQIDLDQTALDYLCSQHKGEISREIVEQMRGHLQSCGFDEKLQVVRGRAMSGGQRSRLAMAAVSFARPHVLILDEPTNNLDVESVEALAESIEKFEGGVVIVSHDQHFVSRVANEVWLIDEGKVQRCESFAAYLKQAAKVAEAGIGH